MANKTKTFRFISDPGHGWLKVTRAELEALGIDKDISHYSYAKGQFVYLEEDCDAGKFIEAYKKAHPNRTIATKGKQSNIASRVRSYPAYFPRGMF